MEFTSPGQTAVSGMSLPMCELASCCLPSRPLLTCAHAVGVNWCLCVVVIHMTLLDELSHLLFLSVEVSAPVLCLKNAVFFSVIALS